MAIEDSNPERRNLVVLSMAIIAFYVGGCEIPSTGEIELPLIKVTFTDARHLAWLIWIMLGWFCFRYYVSIHEIAKNERRKEINQERYGISILYLYFRNQFTFKKSASAEDFYYYGSSGEKYTQIACAGGDSVGRAAYRDIKNNPIGLVVKLIAYGNMFFRKPSLSQNYIPFMMAVVATAFIGWGLLSPKKDSNYYIDIEKFLQVQEFEDLNSILLKLE